MIRGISLSLVASSLLLSACSSAHLREDLGITDAPETFAVSEACMAYQKGQEKPLSDSALERLKRSCEDAKLAAQRQAANRS